MGGRGQRVHRNGAEIDTVHIVHHHIVGQDDRDLATEIVDRRCGAIQQNVEVRTQAIRRRDRCCPNHVDAFTRGCALHIVDLSAGLNDEVAGGINIAEYEGILVAQGHIGARDIHRVAGVIVVEVVERIVEGDVKTGRRDRGGACDIDAVARACRPGGLRDRAARTQVEVARGVDVAKNDCIQVLQGDIGAVDTRRVAAAVSIKIVELIGERHVETGRRDQGRAAHVDCIA